MVLPGSLLQLIDKLHGFTGNSQLAKSSDYASCDRRAAGKRGQWRLRANQVQT
jgi:hypothetical protein